MRRLLLAVLVAVAFAATADDLQRADELAWAKEFAAAEALYRQILAKQPQSGAAKLGLARVVMWQGRYPEAIRLFAQLDSVDALEGRATALYWSGDLRGAARGFREVLERDASRDFARTSLAEIASTALPSQRVSVEGSTDDQPLDAIRSEIAATFFSDPQSRWTATVGAWRAGPRPAVPPAPGRPGGGDRSGEYASVSNETTWRGLTAGGSLGVFTWPNGVRRPIGSASVRYRQVTVSIVRRPELATATSLRTHPASTTTSLRWDYSRNVIAAAEVSHRRYFDGNEGSGAYAYAIVPLRRNAWTFWSGASVAARDTDESRFTEAGVYDPYWTPDNLVEARAVFALERRFLKVHADAGRARDRGLSYHPWRAGLTANVDLARGFRIEAGIERSSTVDYRSTSFHAALVRRR
ncbi:MAG TPA: tetratricopeptide repeat protein [Thermoanaerobaculia bacterium]|jgi:tetratricopeptide (TPR) repeat protein